MRPLHVLADVHEPADAGTILRGLGHTVELRTLGAVDYIVTFDDAVLVLAERKTHRDLVLSMLQRPRRGSDGARRLWDQLDRFEAVPGEAKVLLYKRPGARDPYPAQFPQAMGALLSVQERGHLVLPTRSLEESMRALVVAAGRVQREARRFA